MQKRSDLIGALCGELGALMRRDVMITLAVSTADFAQWVAIAAELGGALAGVAVFVAGLTVVFEFARNRRDATRLRQEQWRISYRNLNITDKAVLTSPATAPVLASGASPSASPFGRKIGSETIAWEPKTPFASQ